MKYRRLGKTGEMVSSLGFGIMRAPYKDGKMDIEPYKKMIEYAYENGVNYFDTAQNYCEGIGESILGEAIKPFREKVFLATKVGIWHTDDGISGIEKLFSEQLGRLQTDYIDFYLIHALTDKRWKRFSELNIIDFFEKKKREGYIRHYGFSFHGTYDLFQNIIGQYDWDFVQMQLNYVDTKMQAGLQGLYDAHRLDLGTIVMEPLRGGKLVNGLSPDIRSILRQENSGWSMAEWGLKYLWNKQEVNLVLSGMSDLEQVKENIRIASESCPGMLTSSQNKALECAGESYQKTIYVPCTNCRYCDECPQGIRIPNLMSAYNDSITMNFDEAKSWYISLRESSGECLKCRRCEELCPQQIKITEAIESADKLFGYRKNSG